MNYESLKSVTLTVLVLLSILLTWNLWTYQPSYESIEEEPRYLQSVKIGREKKVSDLIKPDKVLIHKNDAHYGMTDQSKIEKVINKIAGWNFDEFENISSSVTEDNFQSFIQQDHHIEVIFPEKIPFRILETIFSFSNKSVLNDLSFDRLVIDVGEGTAERPIYFISYNNKRIYRTFINKNSIQEFSTLFFLKAEQNPTFQEFKLNRQRSIFLPSKSIEMERVQYYVETITSENLRDALFNDPRFVKKDQLPLGEVYTDGSRLLSIDETKQMMQYVNPASLETESTSTSDIVMKSIDFVNDHGGWTDDYRFTELNSPEQKTIFRLYINNFPVFDADGMSQVEQVWNNNQIFTYTRPLLILDFAFPFEAESITLHSGEEVIRNLLENPDIDHSLLEGVKIGYDLERSEYDSKLYTLEPAWYYLYEGSWKQVDFKITKELEDGINGLE